jgi:hypothetical protein
MPPDPSNDPAQQRLFDDSFLNNEVNRRNAEAAATQTRGGGSPVGDLTGLEATNKLLVEMNLNMQALAKSFTDQKSMLSATNELQQQNTELLKEQKELQDAKNAALKAQEDIDDKQIAKQAKKLELTKQEDALVRKIKKGYDPGSNAADARTFGRIKSALGAQHALEETGLSATEAARSGGISGYDASILAGGPERARRIMGIPVSEGIGGAVAGLRGNPIALAITAGLSIAKGFGGIQDHGAAGLFSSIPVIGGTITNMLNSIPGFQAATAFGNTTRLGMVTGDGYRTGLSRQFQAWRMGANPFDIVSGQTANEIVQAVAEQGFRGSQATGFQNAILGGYKQTGLPIQQLAAIGTLFAKNKGLDQFRQTIENIDNVARDSSQSVAAVADQIQTLSEALAGKGAAPLGLASDIVAAVSQVAPNLTPEQQKSLATGFMGQPGMEMFSGFPGVAATTTIGRRIARQNQRVFLRAQRQVLTSLPRDQQDLMLANLVNAGIFGSVQEARTMIMHGHSVVHRVDVEARRRNARQSFDSAQIAANQVMSHLTDLQKSDLAHGIERGDMSRAYVRSLTHGLRTSGFNAAQIAAITQPLRGLAHGATTSTRWSDAVNEAHKRAIMQAEADSRHVWSGGSSNRGRFLTVTFDTRDLGKKVSKTIQLDHARGGSSSYVGTDRTGG